jgi:Uri superfamily endonuclease
MVLAHNRKVYLNNDTLDCIFPNKIKLESKGDFFNLGYMRTSSCYFQEITTNKEKHIDFFKNSSSILYLIIAQRAKEFINAEEVFSLKMFGFIEFFFIKNLMNPSRLYNKQHKDKIRKKVM